MPDPFDPDPLPDEIPLADAVEQSRPATEPGDLPVADDDGPPLESSESDWQEQRLVVEDPDEDYR